MAVSNSLTKARFWWRWRKRNASAATGKVGTLPPCGPLREEPEGGIANSGVCGSPLSLAFPHKRGGNTPVCADVLYASRSLA